ncbi:hypothetical protein [Nocardia thailandica]|uniref:hypothetical protein n=1 Tax=Nocardia thailandica TaxID=257275 RepID=UPI0005BDF372|nr:hypothetical protein [Nocardia thailandica]
MRRGAMGVLSVLLLTVLSAPAAHAEPGYAPYLDLPAVNAEGERGGGLNPALPLDVPRLRDALDEARADGIAPRRYATLLHQFWLVTATEAAGIDLAGWAPERGVAANSATFSQVYVNYFRIAHSRPDLYWAGLAGVAGGSFASGFFDIGDVSGVVGVPGIHQLGTAVADLLRSTPPELVAALPEDIATLAAEGPRLTPEDLAWYQTRLMIMQKHIFLDLVPQHEAYLAGGLGAIAELAEAGVIDANARAAWAGIDSGTVAGRTDALIRMTDREQNRIVADQWDATAAGRGRMGRVLSYVSTVAGKPAVPGVRAPGVYAPATVTADVDGVPTTLTVPLPAFNWADRDSRWDYITGDLVPSHLAFVADPAAAAASYAEPFADKLARGRILVRLPELLADLTTQWRLDRS